ncbi:MAG: PQQ-binding-like beta-propeller repeat protein [Vicinamibacterales bacterium]
MSPTPTNTHSTTGAGLRTWPGVVAVTVQWSALLAPLVRPDLGGWHILVAVASSVVVLTWWLTASRAPWRERVAAVALMAAAIGAIAPFVDRSVQNGMMGMMLPVYALPCLSLVLVAASVLGRTSTGRRRQALAAGMAVACAGFLLIRTGGITGDGWSELHWRWTPTPEERLLQQAVGGIEPEPAPGPAAGSARLGDAAPSDDVGVDARADRTAPAADEQDEPVRDDTSARAAATPAADPHPRAVGHTRNASAEEPEWPGFRGPQRDGVARRADIATDWSHDPPVERWRRAVGPGWSSFAVANGLIYTQEQRGDEELVSCYRLDSGEPVWRHADAARFWESNGGAGPRATPAVQDGRVFAMGATGLINALDASTGAVLWSRNAAADTGADVPDWGTGGLAAGGGRGGRGGRGGADGGGDAATGAIRWQSDAGGGGYSSPHLATIDGVRQVLLLRGARTTSVSPVDGTALWEHVWLPAVSIIQPAIVDAHDVLVGAGDAMGGAGLRRLAVTRDGQGWTVEERWTSRALKP